MQQLFRLVVADIINLIFITQLVRPGRIAQHVPDALDDVVHISEIPEHVPVVINLNRLPLPHQVGKLKVGHIRPSPGSVHGKKAQTRSRDAVQMAVSVGHQLIGLFGGRVQTDGVIHVVRSGKGRLGLIAVHRRTGSKEQMLHRIVAAAFQNVKEADDVGVNVGSGIVNAVADSRLSRQVHHQLGFKLCKNPGQGRCVRQILTHKSKLGETLQNFEAAFLQAHIIIIIHIIQAQHGGPQTQQLLRQMETYETGRAGKQNFFRRIKLFKLGQPKHILKVLF